MKRRIVSLAGAAMWLTWGASFSAVMSLIVVGPPYSLIGLGVVGAATMLLFEHAVLAIRRARRLPSRPRTSEDIRMARQFLVVFAGEIAAFAVAYGLMPPRHVHYLPGLSVAIIGVHFLPLARVFYCPRYYALGCLFCAAGVLSAAVAAAAPHSDLPFILPGLALPPGTWAVAGANVLEGMQLLRVELRVVSGTLEPATELESVRLSA